MRVYGDETGAVWIYTDAEVSRWREGRLELMHPARWRHGRTYPLPQLHTAHFLRMLKQHDGTIWAGTPSITEERANLQTSPGRATDRAQALGSNLCPL